MPQKLNLKIGDLAEINEVPDNLRISLGSTFDLQCITPAPLSNARFVWASTADPVLSIADFDDTSSTGHIRVNCLKIGVSELQLQIHFDGPNPQVTIDRRYKVEVFSLAAEDLAIQRDGREPLNAEQ